MQLLLKRMGYRLWISLLHYKLFRSSKQSLSEVLSQMRLLIVLLFIDICCSTKMCVTMLQLQCNNVTLSA